MSEELNQAYGRTLGRLGLMALNVGGVIAAGFVVVMLEKTLIKGYDLPSTNRLIAGLFIVLMFVAGAMRSIVLNGATLSSELRVKEDYQFLNNTYLYRELRPFTDQEQRRFTFFTNAFYWGVRLSFVFMLASAFLR